MRRYREGGGGLGHRRDPNAAPRAKDLTVTRITDQTPVERRTVSDMSLGDVAREIEELQGRKDRGEYLQPYLFRRLIDLKKAYYRMSAI